MEKPQLGAGQSGSYWMLIFPGSENAGEYTIEVTKELAKPGKTITKTIPGTWEGGNNYVLELEYTEEGLIDKSSKD